MARTVSVHRDEIVSAALNIVRVGGVSALNARALARALCCSTQPIFSNFPSMDDLVVAVVRGAEKMYCDYIQRESEKYPLYKASGMAYIRFAKEEPELFKLMYMRDRTDERDDEDNELFNLMKKQVNENTGLVGDDASLFHLEVWSCVHGIATMLATGYLDLDTELISGIITDVYQGLRKRHLEV